MLAKPDGPNSCSDGCDKGPRIGWGSAVSLHIHAAFISLSILINMFALPTSPTGHTLQAIQPMFMKTTDTVIQAVFDDFRLCAVNRLSVNRYVYVLRMLTRGR